MFVDPEDPNYSLFLRWRGVETPCAKCRGSGVRIYSSTATWRGGMGGAAMTRDVCDECWGTGDKDHQGEDLRAAMDGMQQEIARRAGDILSRAVGGRFTVTRPAIAELADELDKLSLKRPRQTPMFREIVRSLAKTLRSMSSDPK